MKCYQMVRETWESLEVGDDLTVPEMVDISGIDISSRNTASSFLATMVSRNLAAKNGKRDGLMVYKKVKGVKPSPEPKGPTKDEFTELEIGEGIFTLLLDLKSTINTLRGEVKEERDTHKELIRQNTELKKLYDQGQQRVIELNTIINGKKGRSVSLGDLQRLVH